MTQSKLETVNFRKDAFIIVEGAQKADRFYIICNGNVRLLKEVEVIKEEKDILVSGDFFGVVSTMSSHSYIETAQAVNAVSLISIKKEQYGEIIQSNPNIALKIIQQFSKQLRYLNESLTQLTLKRPVVEDISLLFKIGEYYFKEKLHNQAYYNQAYYAYKKYLELCPKGQNVKDAQKHKDFIAMKVNEDGLRFKENGSIRIYPQNALFFCEGEPGEELFIIQKGSVRITKIVDNNEKIFAILKVGDIFGEMAILENKPRSASAIAHDGECTVMVVNKSNFEMIVKSQPQIVSRLTTILSERIWSVYRQIASTLITKPLGQLYDALLLHLEKNRVPIDTKESYTFDFGREDLIKMVGLSREEGMNFTREMLLDDKKMQVREGKLYCPDIRVISREVQYYRRMDKRKTNIEQSHLKT